MRIPKCKCGGQPIISHGCGSKPFSYIYCPKCGERTNEHRLSFKHNADAEAIREWKEEHND